MTPEPTEEELRRAYARCKLPSWGSYEEVMSHAIRRAAVIGVAKNAIRRREKLPEKGVPQYGVGNPLLPRKPPQIERHTVDVKRLAAGDKEDT
jgi:hypothetical protein